ncbi:MAG: hypothetical protein K9H49_05650 [Bacteroidales bacterium]|nr:hypothetical protein [Bacteroidales bacterium]MCF8404408.1 hypothetical protein [Bacteroidales bacterium]
MCRHFLGRVKTWYNYGGATYNILTDIIVAKQNSKVSLTIEPGTVVKADTSAMLQIAQYVYYLKQYGGELIAEGTADSLITFTSRNGLIGGWDGIYFHYNSDNFGSSSSLKYCLITNGKNYNIKSEGSAEPRMDNCTINNSDGYDVFAAAPNDVQYATNSNTTIYVGGGTQSINKTWYNFSGGNYVLVGDMIIAKQNDTVRLTIEPGNTVLVDTSVNIQVGQYVYYLNEYGGEIYAVGTPDSIITITSLNGQVGGWDGIYFHYNSDSFGSNSLFDYCLIENGSDYNIRCENTIEPRIKNSTIVNAAGYDIEAMNPNSVPTITNTNSTVYVNGGTQSIDRTWHNFGGDYIVLGQVVVAKQNSFVTLTVQPGVNVKFDVGARIQLGNYLYYLNYFGGEIIADGTYDSIIRFEPWNNTPGGWLGFYFHENADNFGAQSSFKYCVIEGATTNNLNANLTNAIYFDHVAFSNSGENGIYLESSSPYLKLCQVINNDSVGIKLVGNSQPVIGDTLGFGCDLFGNGNYDVYNGTDKFIHAKNNYWNSTDSATIASRIYDYYNNTSLGIVEFMPPSPTSFFSNNPPEDFNLTSLANFEVTSNLSPEFTWEIPVDPNADPVGYYFYYTSDSTWASNIVPSQLLTSNTYTIPETLIGGSWYWWKVKATDGYLSNYSDQTWRFACSLPPTTPILAVPANGANMRDDDFLVWYLSSDPDTGDHVSHYHLQVDDDPGFLSPEIDMNNITTSGKSSSIILQINELPGHENLENKIYYWRVSAIDGFGIESNFSDGSNYFQYLLDVEVKLFLEGPFNGIDMDATLNGFGFLPLAQPYNQSPWNYYEYEFVSSIPGNNIVDWVLIELRNTSGNAATATNIIYRKSAFVQSNGSLVDLSGSSLLEFPVSFDDHVFLAIYHRNHLGIISGLELIPANGKYTYDFTTGQEKVYGGTAGYKEITPGVWGMVAADANADGSVDTNDKLSGWSPDAGSSGYLNTDFNLDGQTDNIDKNDSWLYNFGKLSQIPE